MKDFKDVVILVLIAVFAGVALSGVYLGTKERIALAKQKELQEALRKVCPFMEDDYEETVYTNDGVAVPLYVVRKDGEIAGAGIKMSTSEGFGGNITFLMGVDANHQMTGLYILEHKETPGLGTKAAEQEWWGQMLGKQLENFTFKVKKDKGDVDAITAATITSRAVVHAVGKGLELYRLYLEQLPDADASMQTTEEPVEMSQEDSHGE